MKNEIAHPPSLEQGLSTVNSQELAISPVVQRKQRARSLLSQLSCDQLALLFTWMEKHPLTTVLEMIAAPPPKGFGIKTHHNTLRRLKSSRTAGDICFDIESLIDTCHDVVEQNPSMELPKVQSVLSAMLHDRVFKMLQVSADPTQINRVIDAISKLSALDFKRQQSIHDQKPAATKHHRVDLNIMPPNISRTSATTEHSAGAVTGQIPEQKFLSEGSQGSAESPGA
jgi:hypothetical protein